MDKENDLIFEAYLEEGTLRDIRMKLAAILCAVGISSGCVVYKDPKSDFKIDLWDLLEIPAGAMDLSGMSPEQHRKLQLDIENVLEVKDIPQGGWVNWLETWKANNIG